MRVLSVAGTRPEAIKFAPLVLAMRDQPGIRHQLLATGQHPRLLDEALGHFGLTADLRLDTAGESLQPQLEAALPPLYDRVAPDLVVVQGDTTSAWVAARVADAAGLPVAHLEAGLRSGNPLLPFPEERNRIEIDALAALLFTPNRAATDNLRREKVPGLVVETGNTGVDALLSMAADRPRLRSDDGLRRILVTCHRREAIGAPLVGLATALTQLAMRPDVLLIVPLHPNPRIGPPLDAMLTGHPRIRLTAPLPYPAMVQAMAEAYLLLTDSGGLQEEATMLGLPTLVLRDNSERPEAIACGTAQLVGLDPATILDAATALLDEPARHAAMARPARPFGDGRAAPRIVSAIRRWHAGRHTAADALA